MSKAGVNLDIQTPRWALPLLEPARYKGVHGGRGSGKSWERAEAAIETLVMDPSKSIVCLREVQASLKYSVKRLVENKIESMGVGSYFECQDTQIKCRNGPGLLIFSGLQNHTAESIKSLEDFDIAWAEEAQSLSQRSIDILRPTIRKPGSELWFTWNPYLPTDPIDVLLRSADPPPQSTVIEVNWQNNPWFTDVLRVEMEYDRGRDLDKYGHIWEGGYVKNSEARVFSNWRIEEFETDPTAMFRLGADFGFAKDPTALVRCYIVGRTLYIDQEAYGVGTEIIDLPELFMNVEQAEKWPIVCDSSRPETISHLRKHGFPKVMASIKGAGSVVEGVEFLKTYDIVVHPRCRHVAAELLLYSYKVDPLTGNVLAALADKDNHVIDALRYALEATRRVSANKPLESRPVPTANRW